MSDERAAFSCVAAMMAYAQKAEEYGESHYVRRYADLAIKWGESTVVPSELKNS